MIKNVFKSPSYIKHVDNENYKKKKSFFSLGKNNSWEDLNHKHIKEKSSAMKPVQI